jgi:hypothetical protein
MDFICPQCYSAWGIEEISFQECDSCGYPYETDYDEPDDDFDYSDDDEFCACCGCSHCENLNDDDFDDYITSYEKYNQKNDELPF